MDSVPQKICSKCKVVQDLSFFSKDARKKSGLRSWCKNCCKAYKQANKEHTADVTRKYKLAQKEQINLKAAEYYQKNRERIAKYHRDRHRANPERGTINARRWREANPDRAYENNKKWSEVNPEKRAISKAKRRARKLDNGVFYIREKFMLRLYSSPCVVCGEKQNIHADHIIPLVRGGATSEGNLQPMCKNCNLSKGSRFMVEFRLSRPELFK